MMFCTKRKEKKNCDYKMYDNKPCGRHLFDNEHCIFHSRDIEGKKAKFNKKFRKEFERQKKHEKEYNFRGFVFPGDISFREIEFEKDVDLNSAQFFGKADFKGGQLSGDANFKDSRFSGAAYFRGVRFSGEANFKGSQFSGSADFCDARFFGGADFGGAEFTRYANFNIKIIKEYNSFTMLNAYFYEVKGLFNIIEENKKEFKYSNRTKFLPDNFRLILGEKTAARFPVITRQIRDDMYLLKFKEKNPVLHFLWWLFADCGRSLLRWALWSTGFAFYFAFNFYLIDYAFPFAFAFNDAIQQQSLWSYIYYSVVTFTTLGFGDIIPTLEWVQRWVMAEVITGYIMLGGLISILANKLARRS